MTKNEKIKALERVCASLAGAQDETDKILKRAGDLLDEFCKGKLYTS